MAAAPAVTLVPAPPSLGGEASGIDWVHPD